MIRCKRANTPRAAYAAFLPPSHIIRDMQQLAPNLRPEFPPFHKSMSESIVCRSGRLRIASAVGSCHVVKVFSRCGRRYGPQGSYMIGWRKRASRLVHSRFVLDQQNYRKEDIPHGGEDHFGMIRGELSFSCMQGLEPFSPGRPRQAFRSLASRPLTLQGYVH